MYSPQPGKSYKKWNFTIFIISGHITMDKSSWNTRYLYTYYNTYNIYLFILICRRNIGNFMTYFFLFNGQQNMTSYVDTS